MEIDTPGKDSWLHAQAGSDHVVIVSPDRIAAYWRVDQAPELDEITSCMNANDIILVEGHKRVEKPSIEVVRRDVDLELVSPSKQRFAVVTDMGLDVETTQFMHHQSHEIADLIETKFLR